MATAMPAYAKDLKNVIGNTSIAARAMATVAALNTTVRPAVRTVRLTASEVLRPAASSSRKRDTTNRL
jgi:hypothetical protein